MIIENNRLIEVEDKDVIDGKITIPDNITIIEKNAFKKIQIPIDSNTIRIPNSVVSVGDLMQFTLKNGTIYLDLNCLKNKDNKNIPGYFINIIGGIDKTIDFYTGKTSNHFFSYFPSDFNELLKGRSIIEKRGFLKLAKLLGCFSNQSFSDVNSNVLACQKASNVLFNILKSGIDFKKNSSIFDSIPIDKEENIDFLKFLIANMKKGKIECFEQLLDLEQEKEFKGIFLKTVYNIKKVIEARNSTDIDGKPVLLSIGSAYIDYFRRNTEPYKGVSPENQDIADLYSSRGAEQKFFDEAVELRNQAIRQNVPEHLLGEPNREKTILETVEEIKSKTQDEIEDTLETITAAYEKRFTYEWLNKRHAVNGILGLYTNCCASLTRAIAGRNTAKASIIAKDVQNLIIRDSANNVVAKGTMYLNRELGYGVINSITVNSKVRKKEINNELIVEAFLRGINSFVEKYNEKYPDKPIQQINTGVGYNILEKQSKQFEMASTLFPVPAEYDFHDARRKQYILYKRDKNFGKDKEGAKDEQEP